MAAVQTNQLENLEVREAGRALKVQTDNPHLVSLGSGRLSTTVTLHPLPEGMYHCQFSFLAENSWVGNFCCSLSLNVLFSLINVC